MLSRYTTILALVFACIATLSLAVAASVIDSPPAADIPAEQVMQVYQLPRVVISGRVDRTAPAVPAQGR